MVDKNKEYDLRQSAKSIGYLNPVLIGKDDHIIDGVHRLKDDNNWPRKKLPHIDTRKKRLIARLASNFVRRKVHPKELRLTLNSLAEEYRKEGLEGTVTKTIAKETGITQDTVRKYLKDEYKEMSHAVRESNLNGQPFKRPKSNKQPYLSSTDWDCPHCHKHMAVLCNGRKHKIQLLGEARIA